MAYPPEPWDLRGRMYVSIWAVPRAVLPPLAEGLAHVVRPVTFGGRGMLGTVWAEYEPGGVLHYREMLAAVLVKIGAWPGLSITDIWVDSRVSRDGGRELWGIPKELAELQITTAGRPTGSDTVTALACTASRTIARCSIGLGRPIPGRWPLRLTVAQLLDSQVRVTPIRCRAEVVRATARWTVDPRGPLAYLAHRRPMFTVALRDFNLTFGTPLDDRVVQQGEGGLGPVQDTA